MAPHDHAHATPRGTPYAIGTALNAAFVVAELAAGVLTHSMALIADAGHNAGDVLGLLLAWAATRLATAAPSTRYTYGYGRATILAALANASLLLIAVGAIAVAAIQRLITPVATDAPAVALVAAIGIVINGGTAALFADSQHGHAHAHGHDINRRAVFAHMAGDAAISAGVVLAALLLWATGWRRIDPAVSLALAIFIAWSTRGLLAEALTMSVDAVPTDVDAAAVRAYLAALPGVLRLHDLHIWPISTTRTALTCHLVLAEPPAPQFQWRVSEALRQRFQIHHATLQLENEGDPCALEADDAI